MYKVTDIFSAVLIRKWVRIGLQFWILKEIMPYSYWDNLHIFYCTGNCYKANKNMKSIRDTCIFSRVLLSTYRIGT